MGGAETTQDICQEVFLVAFRSPTMLEDHEKFSSTLCSIARYQAYAFERTKPRLGIKDRLPCEPNLIADVWRMADPAEILDQNERVQRLHLAIKKMRPEYREVAELRYWRGMSVKDMAGLIGKAMYQPRSGLADVRLLFTGRHLDSCAESVEKIRFDL